MCASRASYAEKHSPLQQGFLSPCVLIAAAPKFEGILAEQLCPCFSCNVSSIPCEKQWSAVCLQQLHIPASPGWMWPSHRFCPAPAHLERERGHTAAKRNLPRDKAHICCLHKEVLELSGNSRQLCTGRGGTPGKPIWVPCGNSERGQPRAPRRWGCQIQLCDTMPVSLKPWLPSW